MAEAFLGQWESGDSDNADEFMKNLGMPEPVIAAYKTAKTTQMISHDGDWWVITIVTPQATREVKFQMGQEYVLDRTLDGRTNVKTITKMVNDQLVDEQLHETFNSTVSRQIIGGIMVVTIQAKGQAMTMKYNKV